MNAAHLWTDRETIFPGTLYRLTCSRCGVSERVSEETALPDGGHCPLAEELPSMADEPPPNHPPLVLRSPNRLALGLIGYHEWVRPHAESLGFAVCVRCGGFALYAHEERLPAHGEGGFCSPLSEGLDLERWRLDQDYRAMITWSNEIINE